MNLLYTAHVPEGPGPFPCVLTLHGWGASAHDLLGLAPLLCAKRTMMLCPQGSLTLPIAPGFEGYGWFPLTSGGPADPVAVGKASDALDAFLESALAVYPIDRSKLVVLGFSQGGVMAYDLFLRRPERFAGLVALSSWLPADLRRDAQRAPALEGRPALIVHGSADDRVTVERGRAARDRLLQMGVSVRYREFDMAHEIAPAALRELAEWLERCLFPISIA